MTFIALRLKNVIPKKENPIIKQAKKCFGACLYIDINAFKIKHKMPTLIPLNAFCTSTEFSKRFNTKHRQKIIIKEGNTTPKVEHKAPQNPFIL